MITLTQGEPLKQDDVDAIVNAVNCVGVMGKGIALQFKHRWPANFTEYAAACKAGKVRPGRMFIHMLGRLVQPQYIIIFPTKEHWREGSRPQFIEEGLVDLVTQVQCLGIHSIAIPPLGCGNGGLDWPDVRPLIRGAFERFEVSVLAFWATAALRHRYRQLRTGSFLRVRIRASPLTWTSTAAPQSHWGD